jgi:hypothetical protein
MKVFLFNLICFAIIEYAMIGIHYHWIPSIITIVFTCILMFIANNEKI